MHGGRGCAFPIHIPDRRAARHHTNVGRATKPGQLHPAKTPFQRLLAAGILSTADRVRLIAIAEALDPVQLLRQIARLQDALWKQALT